jgi:dTDP-4-amino-4,6-dideoxygalactose transaminase
VFHTVEGGGIVFKDRDGFEKAKEIINFGIRGEEGIANVGINAKLNEYQAAVGIVNLENIDDILEHRAELFHLYRDGLKDTVELPAWHPEANVNGAYMPILLKDNEQLLKVTRGLLNNNIQSRHYFSPSLDRVFVDSHNYGTKVSRDVASRILCLPMHAHMSKQDVNNVVNLFKDVFYVC